MCFFVFFDSYTLFMSFNVASPSLLMSDDALHVISYTLCFDDQTLGPSWVQFTSSANPCSSTSCLVITLPIPAPCLLFITCWSQIPRIFRGLNYLRTYLLWLLRSFIFLLCCSAVFIFPICFCLSFHISETNWFYLTISKQSSIHYTLTFLSIRITSCGI